MVVKGLWIAKELQLSDQTLTDPETCHATEGACNPQFTREDVVISHVNNFTTIVSSFLRWQ